MATEKDTSSPYDVIVIGSGISGINAAYRIQSNLPGSSYCILEARGGVGGTWDFFRYPGIRSDSDLHTFGFPWRPWVEQKLIADGAAIRKYIQETAAIHGIDQHIKFHHKLEALDWRSDSQTWRLTVNVTQEVDDGLHNTIEPTGRTEYFYARFIFLGTGYYSYDEPLDAAIPGLSNFKGLTVHPQFWPTDLDYSGKKIVVIGSGATAVTLVPALAEKAAHVTMLQRSPSYLVSQPAVDAGAQWARRWLPGWMAHAIIRVKFLIVPWLFINFCRRFPVQARAMIKKRTQEQLPANVPHDPHFEPAYNPWEQRLCLCPDGDFFQALRAGKCDVATGHIQEVKEDRVVLKSGQELECDILVTATGLKIQMAGGSRVAVDGKEVRFADKFLWKGVMMQDVPNLAFCIGYANVSWTLGADATAQLVCRILKDMRARGVSSATPVVADGDEMKPQLTFNLSSSYLTKAQDRIPKAGDKGPWLPKSSYFYDLFQAKYGDIKTGLRFDRVSS